MEPGQRSSGRPAATCCRKAHRWRRLQKIDDYNATSVMQKYRNFAAWPMDNSAELADLMIGTSEEITQMHKDRKALVTDHLSALVLEGTGPLMFMEASHPSAPVLWLNHDIIAKQLNRIHSYTAVS